MIRDDFAGAGGWDEALRTLGHTDVIGTENNAAACATAEAAGHKRLQVDLTTLDPADWQGLDGYVASPPCQPFSAAGKGAGRQHLDALLQALAHVAVGIPPAWAVQTVHDEALDVRSVLVLEPLRVILGARPRWVALEQVPAVLPVWQAMIEPLQAAGYSVAVGLLQAEQYGVPQTRRRAILMASLDRQVALPEPTHTRYRKGKPRQDPGLLPWVSMADALSWGSADLVGFPRLADTPSDHAGTDPRTTAVGRWVPTAAVPGDTTWTEDRPSPTIVGSFSPDVVAAPGWRKAGDGPRQSQPGSVRVSVQEAAVLQSFRPDYPWQGSRTAQYQQVGNAIPPRLAEAVIEALVD